MKFKYRSLIIMVAIFAMIWLYSSCTDDEQAEPRIRYVRITDPSSSDSLLAAGYQGAVVAIMGENLGGVTELWFNDQKAILTPTYITNTTIISSVPSELPEEITDEMTLIFSNGKKLVYPFKVAISEPLVASMVLEHVQAGGVATIKGDYFYPPLTVTFSGGVTGEVIEVDDKYIDVIVPEGAEPGPIIVTTNFGETISTFHFRDDRAFLNYDDLNASGSWRSGTTANEDGLDGNYLLLKGVLNKNQRAEDYPGGGYVSEFWAMVNGRPEGNLLPGDPRDYVMKFEARVPEWYGSYLNICFAPYDHANSNQEYWSNLNARAIWGPWENGTSTYSTDGWITVTIPMTEFKLQQKSDNAGNIIYEAMEFDPEMTGSLTFWVVGSPKADGSPVELHIDNVRIVPE